MENFLFILVDILIFFLNLLLAEINYMLKGFRVKDSCAICRDKRRYTFIEVYVECVDDKITIYRR